MVAKIFDKILGVVGVIYFDSQEIFYIKTQYLLCFQLKNCIF